MDILQKYKQQYLARDWSFLNNLDKPQLERVLERITTVIWQDIDNNHYFQCRKCLLEVYENNLFEFNNKYYCEDCIPKKFITCRNCQKLYTEIDLKEIPLIKDNNHYICCADRMYNGCKFITKNDLRFINFDWYKHCFSNNSWNDYDFTFDMGNEMDEMLFREKTRFNYHKYFHRVTCQNNRYDFIYYQLNEPGVKSPKDIFQKLLLIRTMPNYKLITYYYFCF